MDCQGNIVQQEIDVEEVLFKQALYEKDIPTIQAYLRKHQKLGDSLVGYLYQKNYAALAINLVQDKRGTNLI
jgi:coatomer protein complex subunit alpha (xenin)